MEGSKVSKAPNYDVMISAQSVRPTRERQVPAGTNLGESFSWRFTFRYYFFSLMALCLSVTAMQLAKAETQTTPTTTSYINESVTPWTNLKPSSDFANTNGLKFFRLKTDNGSAACLAVLNLKDKRYIVKPFFNASLDTTSNAARSHNALVATNGGYFNLSNGESASYVAIDDIKQCDPRENLALIENPQLRPYLETIFNRSEMGIFNKPEGQGADITIRNHNEDLPFYGYNPKIRALLRDKDNLGCNRQCHEDSHFINVVGNVTLHFDGYGRLIRDLTKGSNSSLQAGPRLLPKLTDEEEAFVRKDSTGKLVDAIGSHKLAARTAFGITSDGHAMLLCVASKGQNEFSSGVTLAQLASILKILGCSEAINFDGGTSTTMVIRHVPGSHVDGNKSSDQFIQVCGRTPEKLVKSGLMILPANE
jgi:exopolysaccharide biosynthesis protein